MKQVNFFIIFALMPVFFSGAATADTIYGADFATDEIYIVDAATAGTTLVGPGGENVSFSGMAYDTSTGTMYISDIENPGATPLNAQSVDGLGNGAARGASFGLGTVDLDTGAITFIGEHVNTVDIWGLAYDSANDVLYGADGSNVSLATIDRSTGESTIIGPYSGTGAILIAGLAYDTDADVLYGISRNELYTLNRSTGAATLVSTHNLNLDPDNVRIGLDYDQETGDLVAGDNLGDLYRIDTTAYGVISVGNTGVAIDALAGTAQADALGVPIASAWSVAVLAILLFVTAFIGVRRRAGA